MSENKESCEYECLYCYKKFTSQFMRKEHISYSHNSLRDFESSKIYRKLLEKINKLEVEVANLKKANLDNLNNVNK